MTGFEYCMEHPLAMVLAVAYMGWMFWYNNSFTKEARMAEKVCEEIEHEREENINREQNEAYKEAERLSEARWFIIYQDNLPYMLTCSECLTSYGSYATGFDYCPHCGKKIHH